MYIYFSLCNLKNRDLNKLVPASADSVSLVSRRVGSQPRLSLRLIVKFGSHFRGSLVVHRVTAVTARARALPPG
nr:MAG TPA: hypothetical protein [Caudoviricetes sp.]